jgi:hypothetical protein
MLERDDDVLAVRGVDLQQVQELAGRYGGQAPAAAYELLVFGDGEAGLGNKPPQRRTQWLR